jgi:hypothetical protein
VLGAICTVIMLILVSLLFTPPLIAEDQTPQSPALKSDGSDANMDALLGTWEGTFSLLGRSFPAKSEIGYDLSGHWLKWTITAWVDSAKDSTSYVAIVYLHAEDHASTYRAYLVDDQGSGQVGRATVNRGVWDWRWEWDDGTREFGTMVTSAPGRLTYESRITDKAGYPLPSIEMDFNRRLETAKLGR